MTDQAIDCLRLARADGVGPITYRRLLRRYGSAAAAIDALPGLARAGGRAASPAVPGADDARREIERLDRMGGRFLFIDQPGYPALLAQLDDAPPALALLGDPEALDGRAVAVVGSRNASANGQRLAESIGEGLARAGVTVVSGLARGIDAAAHKGALAGGRTVAAVAGGVDVPYPEEHADLQRRIAQVGAVLAEAPLGTQPLARHFPRRNRIIAGLSQAVVVIEAALRSGSLITARIALEADREIMAVPGSPLDPRCRSSNDLMRQGARMVETAEDVLEQLSERAPRVLFPIGSGSGLAQDADGFDAGPAADEGMEQVREVVAGLLGPSPTSVDDLVRGCQLSAAAVLAALLDLEVAGRVMALPGNRFALVIDAEL